MPKRKFSALISPRVIAIMAMLLIAIGISIYPIRSLLWHCLNQNEVSFGKEALTLPLLWWRVDTDDGTKLLRHARFASISSSGITIFPLRNTTIQTDSSGLFWQQAFLSALSGKERSYFTPVTISGRSQNIYCVRAQYSPRNNLLICRVPGSAWGISYHGLAAEEGQAESLIKTLHSLD